mmetsp:Transcript_113369/g.259985  ORF Transcript_113369/g.259985 Transcript_113369/m.259985 type:complete len:241 (+) Transcript_113369:9972-10694(+)
MAVLAGVIDRLLVHQRIGRRSRSVSQSRRGTANIPLTSCVAVALLMVASWASALVRIDHVLANTRAARRAGRAIVNVVAPFDAGLCQLFKSALAVARIVVQVNSGWRSVILACSLVVAGYSPRSGAVVDVLAGFESGQLTVILTPDGEVPGATEHPGRGIPSVALDHLGVSVRQSRSSRARRVGRGRRGSAGHRLARLPGSESTISLALYLKGLHPCGVRISGVTLTALIQRLLLEDQMI